MNTGHPDAPGVAGTPVRPLPDAAATEALGGALAAALPPAGGLIVHLYGELGAGKSTLVRGLLRALGHCGAVRSPTYTLVEPYALARGPAYHFDLYRLADPEELEFIGIRDFLDADALLLVEWPQRGAGCMPAADLALHLDYAGPARHARLYAFSPAGRRVLDTLESAATGAGTG